ncbi:MULTISPECIES: diguanylate cyclase [unclassified Fusibacter]|uniref:sensor domain-containing diguanylate cyclase n=1 Tax=unclassified Fusibacter TaxID=2624464 RepID=UPI0013E9881A|nr:MULTISPECIES: diguanylate cyclase [unclassified Fusibacter]MCK8061491.1 sensor domain-containing diguanylate cyclase [Fusibacter sp. A2]NPE23676.1 GGDEF domain-containing protein [Fusibacter sp. A1]
MRSRKSVSVALVALAVVVLLVALFSETVISSEKRNSIEAYQEVLIDETKALGIQDIINDRTDSDYVDYKTSGVSSTIKDSNYWIHIPLVELKLKGDEYLIEVSKPHLSQVEFFQVSKEGEVVKVIKTGRNRPFSSREIMYKSFLFELDSHHLDGELYLMINTESYLQAPTKLWTHDEFIKESTQSSLVLGVFYGALVIMIVYNSFLAFSLKEFKYLFYVLFVISFTCLQLVWDGYSYQYVWINASYWDTVANPFFISQSSLWLMAFNWSFFEVATRSKWLIRAYQAFFIAAVAASVSVFALPMASSIYAGASLSIVALMVSILSFVVSKPKNKSHFLYIAAWSVFFYMSVLSTMGGFNLIPYSILAVHGVKIGIIILIVFFSLALTFKINEIEELRIAEVEKGNLLKRLHMMSIKTTSIRKLDSLYQNMLQDYKEFTSYESMLICLASEDQTYDLIDQFAKITRVTLNTATIQMLDQKNADVTVGTDDFLKSLGITGAVSSLIIPLESRKNKTGFVLLHSKVQRTVSDQVKELLTDYTYQISMTIENIVLLDRLRLSAERDSLTTLYNRRTFFEKAQKLFSMGDEDDRFSIVMIDIDHFKRINDQFGHVAGDKVIVDIANLMIGNCPEHAVAGRYGGEEFIIAIRSNDSKRVEKTIDDLRKTIMETRFELSDSTTEQMTISSGIAFKTTATRSLDELIERADDMLYRAKDSGRNVVMVDEKE